MDREPNLVAQSITFCDREGTCAVQRFRVIRLWWFSSHRIKLIEAVFAPIRRWGVVPAEERRREIT